MSESKWPFGHPAPEASAGRGGAGDEGWGWEPESEAPAGKPAGESVPEPSASRAGTAAGPLDRRGRFRLWRHSRPFWGAFLLLLGGLIIAVIPLGAYQVILVAPSVAVASGIGWVIVILGVVSFMTPGQNKLYGLLGILAGAFSFVASNLGGFLVGGLLAVTGGALTFAWTQLPAERQPDRTVEQPGSPDDGSDGQ